MLIIFYSELADGWRNIWGVEGRDTERRAAGTSTACAGDEFCLRRRAAGGCMYTFSEAEFRSAWSLRTLRGVDIPLAAVMLWKRCIH